VLSDQARLIRRTQLQRSQYQVLGDPKPDLSKVMTDPRSRDKHLERHDTEVFDDSDFYSKLLRELIDSGTRGSVEAANMGRAFLKKTKRQVDTKASKGRKLRYDVHAKLVNFMPAVGLSLPANAEELFKHLFGNDGTTA
jgi:protein AATF/BFR2